MTREYRGESADEYLGITCPEDCALLESAADLDADYNADLDPNWTPTITLPPLYWARVDGRLQQITAAQYAAIYGTEAIK
jgi:hypothetical protein